jgi:transcription elongation factor GreA
MYNELTEVDIKKMQEEIDYRMKVVRPKCIEDLKTARGFGDLSENYEYKAAKQELRRCDSRLRYLRRMIATAKVIESDTRQDVASLFDRVTIEYVEDGDTETITLMTTLREDALNGIISKESPLGKAVMGRRVGETATVRVDGENSYTIRILKIEKGSDDDSLPISGF